MGPRALCRLSSRAVAMAEHPCKQANVSTKLTWPAAEAVGKTEASQKALTKALLLKDAVDQRVSLPASQMLLTSEANFRNLLKYVSKFLKFA